MNFLNYLKDLAKNLLFAICLWCSLSLVASFFQAVLVESGGTETYIEYVVFTDLFCEVQK